MQPERALNYLKFEDPKLDSIVAASVAAMKRAPPGRIPIAVTHISNIKAMTYVTPASAEMVVVRIDAAGRVSVAGRIAPGN